MPGRRLPDHPLDHSLCRRCQQQEPSLVVRTEPLCVDCFGRYVQTKVVKRMESFRVRNSDPAKGRRLLLPLSFDACSVGLLHILSQHLKGQSGKTGRTGFKLCVVHIQHGPSTHGPAGTSKLADVEARYPEHHYHSIPVSRALSLDDVAALFPASSADATGVTSADQQLNQALGSLKSATARQDATQILERRLIVQSAEDNQCEAILWPDSTTRLAERTLAETAKGRGASLPWAVNDGDSPHGVPFYYPMRELLTKEVEAYISFIDPPLPQGIIENPVKQIVSTKNSTIDDLMGQYFESVEQDYPSIVANVVRTAGKLRSTPLTQIEQQCELCSMPLDGQAPERSRLCYGCIAIIPQADI